MGIRRGGMLGRSRRRLTRPTLETLEGRRVLSASILPSPPQVAGSNLWIQGGQVQGFVITFTKPMAPGPAQNPANYQVYELSPFSQVPLASAVYQASLKEVILIPSHPMPVAKYTVASGAKGHTSPIVDTTGHAINNQGTGYPNGVLFAAFPKQGYAVGIVQQAKIHAEHAKKRVSSVLNHVFNPFSGF
jgi:hypothetical protein